MAGFYTPFSWLRSEDFEHFVQARVEQIKTAREEIVQKELEIERLANECLELEMMKESSKNKKLKICYRYLKHAAKTAS